MFKKKNKFLKKNNKKELLFYNELFDKLFLIPRSIVGDGFKRSIDILSKYIPYKYYYFPSGTKVFDWKVPKAWKVNRGVLLKNNGSEICNFFKNNLSLIQYSTPLKFKSKFKNLKKYLYHSDKLEKSIPYITSYYYKNHGFCIPLKEKNKIKDDEIIEGIIDTEFKNDNLICGVKKLAGKSKKTILISTYLCHPSMANNELSGPLVMIGLYNFLKKIKKRRYTYLFVINPETIGSLCFLKKFKKHLKKSLIGGFVLTCLGGPNKKIYYKLSKNGNSILDKFFLYLNEKNEINILNFDPTEGSDERQYCSPGFELPVGRLSRTSPGTYKEYHTSADNKKFMKISSIIKSKDQISDYLRIIEYTGKIFRKKIQNGEVFLSKYNLYPKTNIAMKNRKNNLQKAVLTILSYANGNYDLIDILKISKGNIKTYLEAIDILLKKDLIKIL